MQMPPAMRRPRSAPHSTANGANATVTGAFSTANGIDATVMGASSTANGIGATATGEFSTANGANATATGQASNATGSQATATGSASTANGTSATATGDFSTANGGNAAATGAGGTANGGNATATGDFSTANGLNATAFSTANGTNATATGRFSQANGAQATASGAVSNAQRRQCHGDGRKQLCERYRRYPDGPGEQGERPGRDGDGPCKFCERGDRNGHWSGQHGKRRFGGLDELCGEHFQPHLRRRASGARSHSAFAQRKLITRGRNNIVRKFLSEEKFTHLFWIDSDIAFSADSVFRLLRADRDVAAGVYPMKSNRWPAEGLPAGMTQKELEDRFTEYPFNPIGHGGSRVSSYADADGFVEVDEAPTGFMVIKRHVFARMMESYPELRYTAGRSARPSAGPFALAFLRLHGASAERPLSVRGLHLLAIAGARSAEKCGSISNAS